MKTLLSNKNIPASDDIREGLDFYAILNSDSFKG